MSGTTAGAARKVAQILRDAVLDDEALRFVAGRLRSIPGSQAAEGFLQALVREIEAMVPATPAPRRHGWVNPPVDRSFPDACPFPEHEQPCDCSRPMDSGSNG